MQYYARMDLIPIMPVVRETADGVFETLDEATGEWERNDRLGSEVRFSGDWTTISEAEAQTQTET